MHLQSDMHVMHAYHTEQRHTLAQSSVVKKSLIDKREQGVEDGAVGLEDLVCMQARRRSRRAGESAQAAAEALPCCAETAAT